MMSLKKPLAKLDAIACVIALQNPNTIKPIPQIKGLCEILKRDDIGHGQALLHSKFIENVYSFAPTEDPAKKLIKLLWFRQEGTSALNPTTKGFAGALTPELFGQLMGIIYTQEITSKVSKIKNNFPDFFNKLETKKINHRLASKFILSIQKAFNECYKEKKYIPGTPEAILWAFFESKFKKDADIKECLQSMSKTINTYKIKLEKEKTDLEKEKTDLEKEQKNLQSIGKELSKKKQKQLKPIDFSIQNITKNLDVKIFNNDYQEKINDDKFYKNLHEKDAYKKFKEKLKTIKEEHYYSDEDEEEEEGESYYSEVEEEGEQEVVEEESHSSEEEKEKEGEENQIQKVIKDNYDWAMHSLIKMTKMQTLPPKVEQTNYNYEYYVGNEKKSTEDVPPPPTCFESAMLDLFSIFLYDPIEKKYDIQLLPKKFTDNVNFAKLIQILPNDPAEIDSPETGQKWYNIVSGLNDHGITYRRKVTIEDQGKKEEKGYEIISDVNNVVKLLNYFFGTKKKEISEFNQILNKNNRKISFELEEEEEENKIIITIEDKVKEKEGEEEEPIEIDYKITITIKPRHTELSSPERDMRYSDILDYYFIEKQLKIALEKDHTLLPFFILLTSKDNLRDIKLNAPALYHLYNSIILKNPENSWKVIKNAIEKNYKNLTPNLKKLIYTLIEELPANDPYFADKLCDTIIKYEKYKIDKKLKEYLMKNKSIALLSTTYYNKEPLSKELIEAEADINMQPPRYEGRGRTPLMAALARKNINTAKLLLSKAKIDLNKTDENKGTALSYALEFCPNEEKIIQTIIQNPQFKATQTDLETAIKKNNLTVLRKIFSQEKIDRKKLKECIKIAIKNENFESFKFLIDKLEPTKKELENFLFRALYNDKPEIIKFILDQKINVNIQNKEGETPLMKAKDNKIFTILLDYPKIKINMQDDEGETALMKHISDSNKVNLLLEHENIDVNLKDNKNRTALIKTLLGEKLKGAKWLLEHKKINVNIQDNKNNTALTYAQKLLENVKKKLDRNKGIEGKEEKYKQKIEKIEEIIKLIKAKQ